jgi:dihydroorotate dehydrogenase
VRRDAGTPPLLVKIAPPDLADEEVVRICELVTRLGLDGIIATNTTISRDGTAHPRHP